MKRFTFPLICTVLLGTVVSAPAVAQPDPGQWAARWAEVDRNGDGAIDRVEAAALPRLAERFDRVDRNRDERIDREELREAWRAVAAQRELRQSRARAMRARFDLLDVDGDGALSLAELGDRAPRLTERFAVIDADGDGRLAREELRAYLQTLRQARQRTAQPG